MAQNWRVHFYDMLYSGSAGPIVHPPSALWHVEAGAGRVWPMCVGTRWPRQLLTRTTVTRTPGLLWTGYIVVTTPVILPRAGHTWGMYQPYSLIFKHYSFYAARFLKKKSANISIKFIFVQTILLLTTVEVTWYQVSFRFTKMFV